MTRHIGGSLLPSNCPRILQPVDTPAGALQVRVIEAEDTHRLFRVIDDALLARHPNGYSCHVLAERIRDGKRAAEQADYIIRCGGHVTLAGWAAARPDLSSDTLTENGLEIYRDLEARYGFTPTKPDSSPVEALE